MPDIIVPPPPSSSKCYTSTDEAVVSRRAFRQHIIVPVFADYPMHKQTRFTKAETVFLSFLITFSVLILVAMFFR